MIGNRALSGWRVFVLSVLVLSVLMGASGTGNRAALAAAPVARVDAWPPFVIGASYEGPATRSFRGDYWAWWASDLFDPQLVDADFARASGAGLNALRVFVQLELLRQIRENNWSELDTVLDLADRHGLRLILTLADYDEPRVAQLARIDGAIAARYAGRQTILAYDLKNEPTVWMLQTAIYPDNQKPPLLSRTLIDHYGEQSANFYIVAYRASDEGKHGPLAIPDRFSEEEAYVYHNNWILSYHLSLEATAWAKETGRTDIEYLSTPQAAFWRPLLEVLDATYQAWIGPRITAIRNADPGAVITVGQHDPLVASLPANQQLDVITLHRYVPAGPDGLADQRRQLAALRALYPDKPMVLGEFGHRATEIGDEAAAIDETATWLHLLSDGYAGGLKWMLNDTRDGTDTMGLFRMDGSARPAAQAATLISRMALAADRSAPATLTVGSSSAGGTCYRFTRGELLALGGRCGGDGGVGDAALELADDGRQLFARRGADGYDLGVTGPTKLLFRGVTDGPARWTLALDGTTVGTLQPSRAHPATLELEPGRSYRLSPSP